MTFEQALEWLAEKWPEKFESHRDEYEGKLWVGFSWGEKNLCMWAHDITQDDIDEILGEIGREYQLSYTLEGGWYFFVWPIKYRDMPDYDNDVGFDNSGWPSHHYATKLKAARAALIAVVEKEAEKK